MAKTIIRFEIDSSDLEHWDDQYLAQLWHIAQANPAPFGARLRSLRCAEPSCEGLAAGARTPTGAGQQRPAAAFTSAPRGQRVAIG